MSISVIHIVGEGLMWALLYVIVVENGITPLMTRLLKRGSLWKKLEVEKGIMGPNLASDTVQMAGFGLQHFFAGLLILTGSYTGNLPLVRHGLLCEWGWETKDFTQVLARTGPYRDGQVSESYRASMKFHHLPGMTLAVPIVYFGVHSNAHTQKIAAIMILAGGVGILANVFRIIMRFGFNANPKAMFLFACVDTLLCFGFFRFFVFPVEVVFLVQDLIATGHVAFPILVLAGFLMMMQFNVTVFKLKLDKMNPPPAVVVPVGTRMLLKRASSSLHPSVGDVDE